MNYGHVSKSGFPCLEGRKMSEHTSLAHVPHRIFSLWHLTLTQDDTWDFPPLCHPPSKKSPPCVLHNGRNGFQLAIIKEIVTKLSIKDLQWNKNWYLTLTLDDTWNFPLLPSKKLPMNNKVKNILFQKNQKDRGPPLTKKSLYSKSSLDLPPLWDWSRQKMAIRNGYWLNVTKLKHEGPPLETWIGLCHPSDKRSLSYVRTTRPDLYQDFIKDDFALAVAVWWCGSGSVVLPIKNVKCWL